MIYQSSTTVHDAARVQRQRISRMPLWVEKTRGATIGDWAAGIIVVAVFTVGVML